MTFENVKGYQVLTEEQQNLLERVYEKHMSCMGSEMREKYTIDKITEVKWDKKENTVNIYFEEIWWHYATDGTWY